MKRGLLARGGFSLVFFSLFSVLATSLALFAVPSQKVILGGALLLFAGISVGAYYRVPRKKRKQVTTFISKNADIIAVIGAILAVGIYFIVFKFPFAAGTINNTPAVVVSIDAGDPYTNLQGGHTIGISSVPNSNTGSAITCYAANTSAFTTTQQCTACASSCTGGPYSCSISSFTLAGCGSTQTVYVRCSDAQIPGTYTTMQSDTIVCDNTAPVAGTISSPATGTYDADGTYNIVWAGGSDAQSGVANNTLHRRTGTLSGTACSSYGAYSSVSSTPGTTAQSGLGTGCYEYKVITCNNV